MGIKNAEKTFLSDFSTNLLGLTDQVTVHRETELYNRDLRRIKGECEFQWESWRLSG